MTTKRFYDHARDYEAVGEFLVRTYRRAGDPINWLQPRWEYMHFHPLIENVDRGRIGIWESGGRIVGVVHPEHRMGQAYFEIDPEHPELRVEMLDHAEVNLSAERDGGRDLTLYIVDADRAFVELATQRGYARTEDTEPMTDLPIPDPFPAIPVPDGFRLQSLADDNDLWKAHCVLWKGFNHGDDPPREGLRDREFMQSAPNFRPDLNIVAVAPTGEFAAYAGMWFEPERRVAYVEPVATDPRYRRMGLGQAAVREGIRRCGALGATVAYVGSTLPIYQSIGFKPIYNTTLWSRRLD